MTALRGKNLRSGDLAEQLGMVMLQHYALVAPVPRTEDVGVDTVLTLLRDYDATRCIAEDSFFVQIKARSVREIKFSGAAVRWLFDLNLPFCIASVDRAAATVELYCAHALHGAYLNAGGFKELTLVLEACDDPYEPFHLGRFFLGPPVLAWQLNTPGFIDVFYSVLKAHAEIANENLRTCRVGWVNAVTWRTNELPHCVGQVSRSAGEALASQHAIEDKLAPYLTSWLFYLHRTGELRAARSLFDLLGKVIGLADEGVVPFRASAPISLASAEIKLETPE